jgi:hypothetical protein
MDPPPPLEVPVASKVGFSSWWRKFHHWKLIKEGQNLFDVF